jgi:tetrahydromethanopterin S-methyltransferase subunit G
MPYNFVNDSGLQQMGDIAGYESQKTFSGGLFSGIGLIISSVLGLVGIIFLALTIYGGFLWMNAQGDEKQVDKAIGIIRGAVIGLVVTFAAYAISYFVITNFGADTLTTITE